MGNNTVQQKDISWSKRILGKLALTQIKVNIINEALTPKIILEMNPDEQLIKNRVSGIKSFSIMSTIISHEKPVNKSKLKEYNK